MLPFGICTQGKIDCISGRIITLEDYAAAALGGVYKCLYCCICVCDVKH